MSDVARLAVDLRHQRQRIGALIPADALRRCLRLSEEIGMIGVVLDERARGWYECYEFERLSDLPLTLWLPAAAIARLSMASSDTF